MSKKIPSVKLYFPNEDVEQIKADVDKILQSGMLTLHSYNKEFEERFAQLCKVKNAIAVNSGTSALEIALRAIGLKQSDEVLVPTNTFTATAAAVFFAGGRPKLTDVNPETLCIDVENVQKYTTPQTKGIIAVHIGGLICPSIAEIREICEDKKLFLIEDAAHAHGSSIKGFKAGSLGNAGCFSFYPTKVITSGEGGMITTDDDTLAEKARVLRDQGKENFYGNTIVRLGYNWRLPEISAAIGITQLNRLEEFIEKRNKVAQYYNRELKNGTEIKPLNIPSDMVSNYYKYIALLEAGFNRDQLKSTLRTKGVNCSGEVYWPPLHLQPIYKELLKTEEEDFPTAEDVCSRMICLPLYVQMTQEEADYVIEKLKETISEMEVR